MKQLNLGISLLVLMLSVPSFAQRAEKSGSSGTKGGGDPHLTQFRNRRENLREDFYAKGGATQLNLFGEDARLFGERMLSLMEKGPSPSSANEYGELNAAVVVNFVTLAENAELPRERRVEINEGKRVCAWNTNGPRPEILCIHEAWAALDNKLQARTVNHEYMGIAGYRDELFQVSNQLTDRQVLEIDYKLVVENSVDTIPDSAPMGCANAVYLYDGITKTLAPNGVCAPLIQGKIDNFNGNGQTEWNNRRFLNQWMNALATYIQKFQAVDIGRCDTADRSENGTKLFKDTKNGTGLTEAGGTLENAILTPYENIKGTIVYGRIKGEYWDNSECFNQILEVNAILRKSN